MENNDYENWGLTIHIPSTGCDRCGRFHRPNSKIGNRHKNKPESIIKFESKGRHAATA